MILVPRRAISKKLVRSCASRSDTPTRVRRGARRSSRHRSTSGLGWCFQHWGAVTQNHGFFIRGSVIGGESCVFRRSSIKWPFNLRHHGEIEQGRRQVLLRVGPVSGEGSMNGWR